MRTVRVIWFRVGEKPEVLEIEDCLEEMQRLVGGYIERVQVDVGVDLWCDEEGLLKELPLNIMLVQGRRSPTPICGNFFLARNEDTIDGQDLASVTDEDIARFAAEGGLR